MFGFNGNNQNLILNAINNLETQICCLRAEIGEVGVQSVVLDSTAAAPLQITPGGTPANPTFAVAWATNTPARSFLASPTGAAGAVAPRTIVAGDLPNLAANPATQIGLTAVNGSATTYMRSDAAPALNQGITPVWTGIHTFANNPTIKGTVPNINFQSGANANLGFVNFGDGAANVPSFISALVSDQLRFTVGLSADATFTIGNAGQIGLGNPVVFGTAGQVLTSGGPTAPPIWTSIPTAITAANPTATVGLAVVNGAATTFMRSDASPALSQAIAPTWSGIHNFTNRIIQTQTTPAAVATATGTTNTSPLTITGGAGGSTSSSTGTVIGGNAGAINITSGNGGNLTGTPATGFGGKAGTINLTGGTGGTSLATGTTVGQGGDIEIAGGTSGTGSATSLGAEPGYVSLKGGNAGVGPNNNGGNIYAVPGIPTGTGVPGGIFLGVSPSQTIRGTVFVGCNTGDLTAGQAYKLFVRGDAIFNNNLITTGSVQATGVATATDPTISLKSTNPVLELNKTNNGANMKIWTLYNDGSGNLFTDVTDDAGANPQHAVQITRTAAAVTSHRFFVGGAIIAAVDSAGFNVTGSVNASTNVFSRTMSAAIAPASIGGPTNTGVVVMAAANYADVAWYDATQAANARSFDIINFQNKIQFRLKNDAGSSTVNPLTFNGGFAGYTGVTANVGTGTWAFNGSSSYTSPVVLIDVPDKPMIVLHASGGLANRKRWFISGENGNFLQHGITDDAGGNPIIGYSMFRGVNVIGGHNWFIGDGTITNPVMQLANTGVTINMSGMATATASAALEVQSTTQGFLPPKMTTTERDAIASPVAGLMLYNSTTNKLNFYNGTAWEAVTSA